MLEPTTSTKLNTFHLYDLVQLGLYFCLRSCGYTKYTRHFWTFQLHSLLEFFFFFGDSLLTADDPIEPLQYATHIFLNLDNKNISVIGELVSQF